MRRADPSRPWAMRFTLCVLAVVVVSGCGRSGVATMTPEDADTSLLKRWNAAVDTTKPALMFHWTDINQFPHPTFQGGTSAAYSQFAAVFVLFLETPGNVQFLDDNDLLDTSFSYGPLDSQTTVTFRGLLASLQGFALVDAADQAQLQELCRELTCS
jgi:hypothetical protein